MGIQEPDKRIPADVVGGPMCGRVVFVDPDAVELTMRVDEYAVRRPVYKMRVGEDGCPVRDEWGHRVFDHVPQRGTWSGSIQNTWDW